MFRYKLYIQMLHICDTAQVVGYECDGCEFVVDSNGLPTPTHSDGTPASFQVSLSLSLSHTHTHTHTHTHRFSGAPQRFGHQATRGGTYTHHTHICYM
eukprot:COSAG03_NODE_787_length_5862_cov_14.468680_11_plen_98_part_00